MYIYDVLLDLETLLSLIWVEYHVLGLDLVDLSVEFENPNLSKLGFYFDLESQIYHVRIGLEGWVWVIDTLMSKFLDLLKSERFRFCLWKFL